MQRYVYVSPRGSSMRLLPAAEVTDDMCNVSPPMFDADGQYVAQWAPVKRVGVLIQSNEAWVLDDVQRAARDLADLALDVARARYADAKVALRFCCVLPGDAKEFRSTVVTLATSFDGPISPRGWVILPLESAMQRFFIEGATRQAWDRVVQHYARERQDVAPLYYYLCTSGAVHNSLRDDAVKELWERYLAAESEWKALAVYAVLSLQRAGFPSHDGHAGLTRSMVGRHRPWVLVEQA